MGLFSGQKTPYLVLLAISVAVYAMVVVLTLGPRQDFARFIGRTNPLIVFAGIIILAFVFLSLLNGAGFAIYSPGALKKALPYLALTLLFGLVIILIDTRIRFAADTNIPWPQSVLFYPAIGLLAEFVFHLLPLTVMFLVFKKFFGNTSAIWAILALVALVEPVYQAYFMAASGDFAPWAVVVVGVHIFLISLVQLTLFRRYDFVSMYAFRLVYYLIWHIAWGHLRLALFF